MLREIDLAGACAQHLILDGDLVSILVPIHKTDSAGSSTYRSLRCVRTFRQVPGPRLRGI